MLDLPCVAASNFVRFHFKTKALLFPPFYLDARNLHAMLKRVASFLEWGVVGRSAIKQQTTVAHVIISSFIKAKHARKQDGR